MLASKKLRGIMAERNCSGRQLANIIGVTPVTFYGYLHDGNMDLRKAKAISDYLHISDPLTIFFADDDKDNSQSE